MRSLLHRFEGYANPEPGEFLSDARTFLFVPEGDHELVGWIYGYELIPPEGRHAMFVCEIEVAQESRGRGHGRALIEAVLAEARARGHIEMWVLIDDGNEAATALYETTGAQCTGQTMFTWDLQ